jgi:chemotaxis protein methyltransferase CheR
MPGITSIEFGLLKKYLAEISGIEIPEEKKYLFTTRLTDFMKTKKISGFSELYSHLLTGKEPELTREFVQCMTTHESSFFRDSRPFTVLTKKLLPEVAGLRSAASKYLAPRIRILSAGCSLGQEPYTIAMCVADWLATQNKFTREDVAIVAIDISRKVLERAFEGKYSELEMGKAVPDCLQAKYFKKIGQDLFEVVAGIRSMVKFSEHNLSQSFTGMGKFDIVFCRNVIIYFPLELKQKILNRFSRLLNPGGILFLGASETTYNLSNDFAIKHSDGTSYYVPQKPAEG